MLRGEPTPPGETPLTQGRAADGASCEPTRALAEERPTIVLIEDLHFAPERGARCSRALALAVPDQRVLLLGTTRPGSPRRGGGASSA